MTSSLAWMGLPCDCNRLHPHRGLQQQQKKPVGETKETDHSAPTCVQCSLALCCLAAEGKGDLGGSHARPCMASCSACGSPRETQTTTHFRAPPDDHQLHVLLLTELLGAFRANSNPQCPLCLSVPLTHSRGLFLSVRPPSRLSSRSHLS